MPPTPWQTEILEPAICAAAVLCSAMKAPA